MRRDHVMMWTVCFVSLVALVVAGAVAMANQADTQTIIGKDGQPKTVIVLDDPPVELTPIDYSQVDSLALQIAKQIVVLRDATVDGRTGKGSIDRSWIVNGVMITYRQTDTWIGEKWYPAFAVIVTEAAE